MKPEDLQLRDLVPAGPLVADPGHPWWVWLGVAIAALALLAIPAWFIFAEKPRKDSDLRAGIEAAYKAALLEIESIRSRPAREAATTASAALRRYLAIVCGDPSLFETHEEFLARQQSLATLPEELRSKVVGTFGELARLKYDKDRSGDTSRVAGESRELLDRIHRHAPA